MTDFLDGTIRSYVDQAASNSSTPGGGSVSALVAALGNSMASMAANFTAGKKKFAAVDTEIREILAAIDPLREKLLRHMQDDSVAFAAIGNAYGLPKGTDEEKVARAATIQDALKTAMEIPLEVMRGSVQCLERLPRLAEIGNPNLVSDTGVAAILLEAAVRAAHLNVLINIVALKDETIVNRVNEETLTLMKSAQELATQTTAQVRNTIMSK